MIANDIRDRHGKTVGFRCTQCGCTYMSGWGSICNSCRKSNEDSQKLRDEIKALKELIKDK